MLESLQKQKTTCLSPQQFTTDLSNAVLMLLLSLLLLVYDANFSAVFTLCVLIMFSSVNPLVTNGFSHRYHSDESIFNFRLIGSDFSFLFHFSMKNIKANRIAPDGTPRFAASHLGLFCLLMPHKKDTRLIWVKVAM